MTQFGTRVALFALHLVYVGALWVSYRYSVANNYWQSSFVTDLLGFLIVATVAFLYCWRALVRRLNPEAPVGRLWLTFGSGVWVGFAIAVYGVVVLLDAAAVKWGSWQF